MASKRRKKIHNNNLKLLTSLITVMWTSIIIFVLGNLNFENTYLKNLLIIIFTIINAVVGYFPLFSFFKFGGQKWIIKQFVPIIFNALFSARIEQIKNDKSKKEYLEDCCYRVSYYKYYHKDEWILNLYRLIRKVNNKTYKNRIIPANKDVLLCTYRYGLEDGKFTHKPSSVVYTLDECDMNKVKGVAGLIAKNNDITYECLDNVNINNIIAKLKANNDDIGVQVKENEDISLSESIVVMKNRISSYNNDTKTGNNKISEEEENEILEFMKKTHTDYNAMFDISGGKHANHFLGFKVYNVLREMEGIIIIDARENDSGIKFHDIVSANHFTPTNWIDYVLQVFSGITSETLAALVKEEDKKRDGERVGN